MNVTGIFLDDEEDVAFYLNRGILVAIQENILWNESIEAI
jgi:hypothetical protein